MLGALLGANDKLKQPRSRIVGGILYKRVGLFRTSRPISRIGLHFQSLGRRLTAYEDPIFMISAGRRCDVLPLDSDNPE
jgi:hypothetical protein